MARTRVILVLLVAIAAGGGLAFGTYNYVQNVPAQRRAVADAPVVVAATDLAPRRRRSGSRTFASSTGPPTSVPAGAFAKPEELIGRGLIMPVIQNEPILPMKLASKEAGAGLPPVIPDGLRAVSVRVNDVIGVAGYVLPGTRVDVVATVSPTENQADMTSKVDSDQRAGARGRHQDRARRRKGQADAGERRDAARRSRSRPSG